MPTKTAPFGFRFDKALLQRIEAIRPKLEKRALGTPISMSAVVRALLLTGLEVLENQLTQQEC